MFEKEIARGCELLTTKFGNELWRGQIDPDLLDMHNAADCVLGQLFGGYFKGATRLFGEKYTHDQVVAAGFQLYFSLYGTDEEMEDAIQKLTEEWVAELTK